MIGWIVASWLACSLAFVAGAAWHAWHWDRRGRPR